ncbi:MAG: hypothetical protein WBL63_26265 [Candidatus Acidiferrum sp.]
MSAAFANFSLSENIPPCGNRHAANYKKEQGHAKGQGEGSPFLSQYELLACHSIAGSQKAFEEEQQATANEGSNHIGDEGHLKNTLGYDQRFERH